MGVRRVERGVVRVPVIGFVRAEGDAGSRRRPVPGVRRGAGSRLSSRGGAGGGRRGVRARLRLDGRHAAAVAAVGGGRRAGAVDHRLLQADERLGRHVARRIHRVVDRGVGREDVRPVGV